LRLAKAAFEGMKTVMLGEASKMAVRLAASVALEKEVSPIVLVVEERGSGRVKKLEIDQFHVSYFHP
jgi:hypothetical protein